MRTKEVVALFILALLFMLAYIMGALLGAKSEKGIDIADIGYDGIGFGCGHRQILRRKGN